MAVKRKTNTKKTTKTSNPLPVSSEEKKSYLELPFLLLPFYLF